LWFGSSSSGRSAILAFPGSSTASAHFFPGYPDPPYDAFLDVFKRKAEEYGIAISGTGIRNDFANPDPQIRVEGIQRAIQWLEVASKLEAPVLRCFAGKLPQGYEDQWEIPAQWVIESVE
jgi:sugar phosphate isomerase/epimerase